MADWNPEEMDSAAKEAETELLKDDELWSIGEFAEWWSRWYIKAGHKRLGRILVRITKAEE